MPADLHAHLRAIGKDQELYVPRANETPLGITREVMSGGIQEAVERLFQDDFDAFGDRRVFDDLKFATDGWSADAIAHVQTKIDVNAHIGEVWMQAKRWRRETKPTAEEVARLEKRLEKAERRVQALEAIQARSRSEAVSSGDR
jgi:hypothetical protein